MSSNNSLIDAENVGKVGLGYGIAIAVGILILVTTIMLASYVCVRVQGRGQINGNGMANSATVVPQSSSSSVNEEIAINIGEINYSGEWSSPCMGLGSGQKTIDSYPKIVFSRHHKLPRTCRDTWCSICLGEYKYKEVLRLMPDCRHCFHALCIDAWLKMNASCPLCRTSPLLTPLPTPLSERIPLAR